jgi:hypothetical protein
MSGNKLKTLEDFKNEIATELGHINWSNLIHKYGSVNNTLLDRISLNYAKYIQEETIKRCVEEVRIVVGKPNEKDLLLENFVETEFMGDYSTYIVDKDSILNIERILK